MQVDLIDQRVRSLLPGQRQDRWIEDSQLRSGGRLRACSPHRQETQALLFHSIDPDQLVHLFVEKAHPNFCRELLGRTGCQAVRQDSPTIPIMVPVSARLVLPGTAPGYGCVDERQGRLCDVRIISACLNQVRAEISAPQADEGNIFRTEVVYTRR